MTKLKSTFEVDDATVKSNNGIYLSKGIIIAISLIVSCLLIVLPIIVYFTKPDVNFDKISSSPLLGEKTWNDFCINYACDNTIKLNDICYRCSKPSTVNDTFFTTLKLTSSTASVFSLTTNPQVNNMSYRLPHNLKPIRYDINIVADSLKLNTTPDNYNGLVDIYFKCHEDTNKIIFHIKNIEIKNSSLYIESIDDDSFEIIDEFEWRNDFEREFFIAEFNENIFKANHEYLIHIDYKGFLKDDNIGFYRSSYLTVDGTRRWLFASQMSPTNARKAFPCFDEPGFKAIFRFQVVHDASYYPLSNMNVESSTYINTATVQNRKLTKFYPTPVMSTFIVGLIISDFSCIHNFAYLSNNRVLNVSACSRPNAINQLDYALNSSIKILDYLEKYCDYEYTLPKLHHIAIPDFAAGAMENWGLIKYREARLLYDANKTSDIALQNIVSVISHESAHLWFGNLVSPNWWSFLWLKEGFARFMEYYATDHLKPEWGMRNQFAYHVFTIMQVDSVASSHKIAADVSSSAEVTGIFDDISYGKGAAIVRLLLYILGDSTFQNGLRLYLKTFAFKSVSQDDLWNVLHQQALSEEKLKGINFSEVMNTWTKQMGHPVVKIEIENNEMTLTQQHFLLNPLIQPSETSEFKYKWHIPFTYSIETNASKNLDTFNANETNIHSRIKWFEPTEIKKKIILDSQITENKFILANLDAFGYYRVNYDSENWKKIINQLKNYPEFIPTRIRAQLLNDAFGFSQAFIIEPTIPVEISTYLTKETEHLPWVVAIECLRYISDQLQYTLAYGDLQNFFISLIKPIFIKLSWNISQNDSWPDRLLRKSVLEFACMYDLIDCVDEAKKLYKTWIDNVESNMIEPSFRSFVYCTAIRHGGQKEWLFASDRYEIETDSNSRNDLQFGMSCSKEPWLIKRFLNDQLNSSKVRTQDSLAGLRYVSRTSYGNSYAWSFIKDNWDELFKRYGSTLGFARLFPDLVSKFNTQKLYDDFQQFFQSNTNQGSANAEIKLSLDKISANILWIKLNYEALAKWLKNFSYSI